MSTSSTTPIMTAETETIPEDVQQMAVQFRCCSSDGCIRADDECGEQGLCIEGRQIARAILAERERCLRLAEEVAMECQRYSETQTVKARRMASSAQAFAVRRAITAMRGPTQ